MQDQNFTEEAPEIESEEVQEPVAQPVESDQERNWKNTNRLLASQKNQIEQLTAIVNGLQAPPQAHDDSSDEEILTKGEYKRLDAERQKRNAAQYAQTAEQIFAARNPDYNDLISKYIPKLIEKNPALLESLKNNPNAHEIVYNLIKDSSMYQKDKDFTSKKGQEDAKKIIKNSSQPVSGNAAARGALKSGNHNYESMSNADIIALAKARAKGQA